MELTFFPQISKRFKVVARRPQEHYVRQKEWKEICREESDENSRLFSNP